MIYFHIYQSFLSQIYRLGSENVSVIEYYEINILIAETARRK